MNERTNSPTPPTPQGESYANRQDTVRLQRRAVEGSVLALASHAVKLALNVGTIVILAAYLGREEFGLVAVAFSIQTLLIIVRDGGLANALIQKRDLTDLHVNSVLWVGVTAGIILAAILALLARPIARFYERPELTPILWLMALPILAQGFGSVQEAQFRRNLQFRRLMLADSGSVFIASLVAVVAAIMGLGVWSLVLRLVLGPILFAGSCWCLSSWRPRRTFSFQAVRSLWSFGAYLLLSTLFGYGLSQLDGPIIGKLIGVTAAGTFFMARHLTVRTIQDVTAAVVQVMFPVFSVIQDQPATIASGYLTGTRCLAVLIFPIVALFVVMSPEIVSVVLGGEWRETVPLLQVLSLHGVLICINYPAGQILYARGRSRLVFILALFRGVAVLASFVIGCRWGVLGVALSWTVVRFAFGPFFLWFAAREVGMSLATVFANVARPALAAVLAAVAVQILYWAWTAESWDVGYLLLFLEAVVGLITYGGLCLLLLKGTLLKIKSDLTASGLLHRTG